MKVSVKRVGGFAGLTEEVAAVDTAQLDAAAAQQVEQIIQSVGFFDLPAAIAGDTIGADLFQYEITVSEGDRQHTVTFMDDESPETAPLRRLVETLTQMR
jgi:Emfourin